MRRRALIAGLAASALPFAARAKGPLPLALYGNARQGAALIGHTEPGARVIQDGQAIGDVSRQGFFIVGFEHKAGPRSVVEVATEAGQAFTVAQVKPGDFDVQRISGLPQATVTPQGEALLARIKAEAQRKAVGFSSNLDREDFRNGFIPPIASFRLSSRWGGERILNGTPATPHYGVDLAAPAGTPIRAPAGGVVSFAETGLFYEGGLTMIDHGQGLLTVYLHQSRVDVRVGQEVAKGELIGAVGAEGRASGPHLCWRMKWRGRNLDPMTLVGVSAA